MSKEKFDKRELLKYIGDTSQLFGVKDYVMNGGKAKGVRAIDIKNGSGLELTIIPDRALDIASFSYKGMNFSYLSTTGIVGAEYFSETGLGFFRNFYAGFLSTCGLNNVGSSCIDNGEELGIHGLISNIPAEEVYAGTDYSDTVPVMRVKGRMREARFFGENLLLEREISVCYGENKVHIKDMFENNGFKEEPFMLLYHFNLGYPLLTEDSYIIAPSESVIPRDEEAEKGINEYMFFQPPTANYSEQVFYHDLKTDNTGKTFVALINPINEKGVAIWFDKSQLGRFTQWKQMGEGEYVLGLEPCNCYVSGRAKAREDGTLEFIKPGEKKYVEIEIQIIDGQNQIDELKQLIKV